MADTCDISGCSKPAKNVCGGCDKSVCDEHVLATDKYGRPVCVDCY